MAITQKVSWMRLLMGFEVSLMGIVKIQQEDLSQKILVKMEKILEKKNKNLTQKDRSQKRVRLLDLFQL